MPYSFTDKERDALITSTALLVNEVARVLAEAQGDEKLENLRRQHSAAFLAVSGIDLGA